MEMNNALMVIDTVLKTRVSGTWKELDQVKQAWQIILDTVRPENADDAIPISGAIQAS